MASHDTATRTYTPLQWIVYQTIMEQAAAARWAGINAPKYYTVRAAVYASLADRYTPDVVNQAIMDLLDAGVIGRVYGRDGLELWPHGAYILQPDGNGQIVRVAK